MTRYWLNAPLAQRQASAAPDKTVIVDEQPLTDAKRLAALAVTPEEQELGQKAVLVADHEVDLAFAAALHKATRHPAPLSAEARPILDRVEGIQDRVTAEQNELTRLKQLLPKVEGSRKADLDEEIQLEEIMLEVDQEDLDAAQQELIRAGGDPRSTVQRLMEQHEAWRQAQTAANPAGAASSMATAKSQQGESRTLLAQWRAWRQLAAKENELAKARQELKARADTLTQEHQALTQNAQGQKPAEAEQQAPVAAPGGSATPSEGSKSSEIFSALKVVAEEQRNLAEMDKRVQDLQQLDGIYGQWDALVKQGKRSYLMGLGEGALWIALLLVLTLFANRLLHSILSRLAPESRRLRTIQTVARFAVQVTLVALILLVIFGPPSQLATVLALAGAGLTVALKDFIVGFFGWFVLMGRNGIRPGDWVEINGVGGEVLEVGLLHTVLLETGNWSDAGHPTGRKVTFVNSFAIEGHYFNFSTSGQWLWDELEVPLPAGTDPYPVAEAVQNAVVAETQANMLLAQQEWKRVVPGDVGRTFSAAPAVSVRPTTLGVNVIVRYITRAHERHEVRARLFHQIIELLRSKQIAPVSVEIKAVKPIAAAS